jgi:hypothetical protein
MAKGDVYLHSNFHFSDGTFGKKYFVILFEPDSEKEPYLVVKTTSNLRNKVYNIGCNEKSKIFYIPSRNTKIFPIDTLIQLDEIFAFSKEEFLKGSLQERIIEYKDKLDTLILSQLINCIKKLKEDISDLYFDMINRK